nr:MAG TPA: hypothetical protein [Caudoviricetes sp.]
MIDLTSFYLRLFVSGCIMHVTIGFHKFFLSRKTKFVASC